MSTDQVYEDLRNLMRANPDINQYVSRAILGASCRGLRQYIEANPEEAVILLETMNDLVSQEPEINDFVEGIRQAGLEVGMPVAKARELDAEARERRLQEIRDRAAEAMG